MRISDWSSDVCSSDLPIDFMPFSGRNHGSSNIYVHTGDSGMGITNGVAGSLTILPLIIGEDSRYAPLFDPGRKAASIPAATAFAKAQAGPGRHFREYLGSEERWVGKVGVSTVISSVVPETKK